MQCAGYRTRRKLIEVAAVNPIASMQAISNPALGEVAQQVTSLLQQVIENLDSDFLK